MKSNPGTFLFRLFLATALPFALGCSLDLDIKKAAVFDMTIDETEVPSLAKGNDLAAIKWSITSGTHLPLYSIALEVSLDDGETWLTVDDKVSSTSTYNWSFPTGVDGTYLARLRATTSDGNKIFPLKPIIVDNTAPLTGGAQLINTLEDQGQSFQINSATDLHGVFYEIVTPPEHGILTGCTLGDDTRDCHYMPEAHFYGVDHVTYRSRDQLGNYSSPVTLNIAVAAVPDTPIISTLSCPLLVSEASSYYCKITAIDFDPTDTLSYSLAPDNTCSWASVNVNTGDVTGTPLNNQVGSCTLAIQVYDQTGLHTAWSYPVTAVNIAPTLSISNIQTLTEDAGEQVVVASAHVVSDAEGLGGTYSLLTPSMNDCASSGAVSIDSGTGEIRMTPSANFFGVCKLNIQMDDGFGESKSQEISVTITNVNDAPTIVSALCGNSINQDDAFFCNVLTSDVDGDSLTVLLDSTNTCSWVSVAGTNALQGTPGDSNVGSCTLAFKVFDGVLYSNVDSRSFSVINVQPTLNITATPSIQEDGGIQIIASDSDIQASEEGQGVYAFAHATTTAPRCVDYGTLSLNSSTGQIQFDPVAHYFGTCFVKVDFDDGNAVNNKASSEFPVAVQAVNDAPTLTAIPSTQNLYYIQTISNLSATASTGPSNESPQTLSWAQCTSSNPSRLSVTCGAFSGTTAPISLTSTAGVSTTVTVTLQVQDSGGGTDTSAIQTFTVYVHEAVILNITSSLANYNIYAAAGSPSVANNFIVTISSGVIVYGSTASVPALSSGNLPAGSIVRIVNNGYIYGAGGKGGNAGGSYYASEVGQDGGSAISTTVPIYIDNTNGYIFGGGGGGAGGTQCGTTNILACGGSGGGGRGYAAGAAGILGGCYSGANYPNGSSGGAGSFSGPGGGGGGASSGVYPNQWAGGTCYSGAGGAGGEWGSAGGSAGNSYLYGGLQYYGNAGGAAGKAVQLNGNTVNWIGGNNASQVKGPVQ